MTSRASILRKRLWALGLAACGGLALVLGVSAHAQDPNQPVVLHQDVLPPETGMSGLGGGPGSDRNPSGGASSSSSSRATDQASSRPVFGPEPSEGQNPTAFAEGSKILPEPAADAPRADSEPVMGRGGFAADRDTQARPDSSTGPDSTLQYVTVFNPSVLPFKRMSAMDAVRPDYTLYTRNPTARRDLSVGGSPGDGRDLFWGSLMVELKPGEDVPIPSVAPDMRILSYETTPRISVTFSKDGSDNFYVRSDESNAAGTYRLVFLADAGIGYFAPEVPSRYRVADLPSLAPAGLIEPLPPKVQEVAERVHRLVGVSRGMRLDSALDKLVYYFRGFEPKDVLSPSGDIYWDLVVHQAGVCRHRSFAFMITANALGIPTRYMTNEAHAWVEVWVPEKNWLRVDLGGAALRMQVDNASDKSLYQPRGEDPFKSPESYENNYTQLEGDISGLSNDQIAERRQPPSAAAETANFDPGMPEQAAVDQAFEEPEPAVAPDETLPKVPAEAARGKTPTRVTVTEVDPVGYRGESLSVSGLVETSGSNRRSGVGSQRVSIWLAPAGQGGRGAEMVGHTVTDADGRFAARIELPKNMQLSSYEVYASTTGDARYAPALSE